MNPTMDGEEAFLNTKKALAKRSKKKIRLYLTVKPLLQVLGGVRGGISERD